MIFGVNEKRKGGLLQNPPLKPKPKLLLLMKTNFYYYFDFQIVCQLFKSFVGNCYLLNAYDPKKLQFFLHFNVF